VDILNDTVSAHHYKAEEDLRHFRSERTGRGPLQGADWKEKSEPIMCSYKLVEVKLDVWGMGARVEEYLHKTMREILLVGHRQAFAWIDDWYDMSVEDVRQYEADMQESTNERMRAFRRSASVVERPLADQDAVDAGKEAPTTPPASADASAKRGWFSWY